MDSSTHVSILQTPVIVVTVECPAQENNLKPLLVLYFLPEPMISPFAYYILQLLMIERFEFASINPSKAWKIDLS